MLLRGCLHFWFDVKEWPRVRLLLQRSRGFSFSLQKSTGNMLYNPMELVVASSVGFLFIRNLFHLFDRIDFAILIMYLKDNTGNIKEIGVN